MNLPAVAAEVTAEAVAALPARLAKRLDAVVEQAGAWPVSGDGGVITVRADDRTIVTLSTPVVAAGDAVCSCLLAPRCLHRAAVLSRAPVLAAGSEVTAGGHAVQAAIGSAEPRADAEAETSREASRASAGPPPAEPGSTGHPTAAPGSTGSPSDPAQPGAATPLDDSRDSRTSAAESTSAAPGGQRRGNSGEPVLAGAPQVRPGARTPAGAIADVRPPVTEAQRLAAAGLVTAASAVLATGIPGAGAVAQAELLRAVHQARAVRLFAPAAAAVRVVEHLRAARRDDPAFRLAVLTDDLREVLVSCHRVTSGDASAAGVARRAYGPVGDLRLHGIFCEPVRAATGHAGAVTYLADAGGRIWVVSDVKPADPAAAVSAAHTSVELGEARLSHHDLARGGLLAVNAQASATGRLSHGRARQAVSVPGAGWFDTPLDMLWQVVPAAQVERWLTAAALPEQERPASYDLAFLDGTIVGADRRGLLLSTEHAGTLAVTAALDDPALPHVTNLRLLATHAAGHPVRFAGRFLDTRRVAGLAFAARWLPSRHGGHADLGTVRLTRADMPGALPIPPSSAAEPPAPAPLHLLRHHLERVVSAGRPALLTGVAGDAHRLTAAHLGGAAAFLTALGSAGMRRTRDVFGRLDPHDVEVLAQAWLTAAIYEQAAARETIRAAWAGASSGD
ncbi:hypothetical protein Aph02nite_39790 [Actinoplanes philippinensis]|uniref:SWIM zinc finger n=1 Tax=Actinoplanes philippinensis TaxID=35752 RepID=A0A1I2GU37_9ACTN|nr:SWIM zinc finger family protein [Actinoplanes philippinensis]GIE78029.1 hypothetical protein Aph02nite_39790 [Actinoplanes philippinensis]SFF20081.1 SWIM zinc finger [Actinoplanes philippinensis]